MNTPTPRPKKDFTLLQKFGLVFGVIAVGSSIAAFIVFGNATLNVLLLTNTDLAANLIAHWSFDTGSISGNQIADKSGNSANLTQCAFGNIVTSTATSTTVYSAASSNTFTVPSNISPAKIDVKAWGAGGGGGSGTGGGDGGGGGFARGYIDVTAGESLTVIVGTGGAAGTNPIGTRGAGAGGGYSTVKRSTTFLIQAGAGGGGGGSLTGSTAGAGGAGGGSTGVDGGAGLSSSGAGLKGGTGAGGSGGAAGTGGTAGTAGAANAGGNGGATGTGGAGGQGAGGSGSAVSTTAGGGGGGGGRFGGGGGGSTKGTTGTQKVVFVTSGTSWTVPSDWNSNSNTIEVIGAGGGGVGGGGGQNFGNNKGQGGAGGGAGAYSKETNVILTPGASVTIKVGSGGAGTTGKSPVAGSDANGTATAGSDTYVCNSTSNCSTISGSAVQVGAKGGAGGATATGGAGGASGSGVGSTKTSGGTGGNGVAAGSTGGGAGGGAGAAGPTAGTNGYAGSSSTAGAGGQGDGTSGGAGGSAGGGTGGNGQEYTQTSDSAKAGSGGGGGGGSAGGLETDGGAGGTAGVYGAGGAGGGGGGKGGTEGLGGTGGGGSAGRNGIIVVTYTPISNAAGGGGGGGSDLVSGTNTTETAGSGTTVGNTSDADKPTTNTGKGGTGGSSPTAGKDGGVVLAYQVPGAANGTLCTGQYGTPTVTPGKVGQAVSFATITNGGTFATTTTASNAQTISFWLHEATSTADDILQISSSAYVTWSAAGAITTTGFTSPTVYVNGVAGATTVATSTWTHVVITTDTPILADDIRLGNVAATLGYFDGTLDDVRLYSVALTASQVSRLYQLSQTFYEQKTLATNPNTVSGLVAHWSFDNTTVSGTTVTDASGNSQNLGFWTDTATVGSGTNTAFITSGTTWAVPSDWNSSNNSIQAIGAGGNGAAAVVDTNSGGGGGGGEYRKATNVTLTAGSTVDINIPSGGAGSAVSGTYMKNGAGGGGSIVVEAKNGGNASAATAGAGGTGGTGAAANFDGGAGGAGATSASRNGGGGGGGSAGPTGIGKGGGANNGTVTGGGGGGGSNGGTSSAGAAPSSTTGGAGGNGTGGTGSGAGGASDTNGSAGTLGGGGGGSGGSNTSAHTGGAGGSDTAFDATHGAGGGGGGGGDAGASNPGASGGAGGAYGGGGGGGGESQSGTGGSAGTGGQGIIVVTYTPAGGYSSAQSNVIAAVGQTGRGMLLASTTSGASTGTATYATSTNIATGVKTISFWLRPTLATQSILQLSSSAYVTESSNTIATTGITSPTIYVNGVSGATSLTLDAWNHVVITTNTAITASDFRLGKIAGQTNPYFSGVFDDVYLYSRAITASEVTRLYQLGQGSTVNKTLATPVPQTSNLLLWYTFDGPTLFSNVKDSSASGANGQLTGATSTVPGKLGQALSFRGSPSRVSTAVTVSNIQTVAFWARASTTAAIAQGLINLTGSSVYISTNASKVISGTGFTSPTYYMDGAASTTPGLYDDNWHHVVVTSAAAITGSQIEIGRANSVFFGGSLDDVRFYSSVLSAANVLRLYQQ